MGGPILHDFAMSSPSRKTLVVDDGYGFVLKKMLDLPAKLPSKWKEWWWKNTEIPSRHPAGFPTGGSDSKSWFLYSSMTFTPVWDQIIPEARIKRPLLGWRWLEIPRNISPISFVVLVESFKCMWSSFSPHFTRTHRQLSSDPSGSQWSDSPWKNPNSRTADSSQASQASAPADRGTSYDPRFDRSHTQRGHGSMRGSPVRAQHPAHWRHHFSSRGLDLLVLEGNTE